jgi:hypothetical protein
VTLTPSPTVSPISTAPTATSVTPTATGGTPEPTVTATPDDSQGDEIDVSINVETNADFLPPFNATITYPVTTGSFTPLDCDADDGLVAQDDGSGTLTLAFASNPDELDTASLSCVFHQLAGQTLTNGDLDASVDPTDLTISIDDL